MSALLQFPPFAIDLHRRRLTREGTQVDLSPRLVDILAHLASHPTELVGKDELLDRFWPDVHVTENTLTRAIADIRKALGDEAGEPRFIQTVARRGYRFIGNIESAPVVTPPKSATSDPFVDWVKGRLSLETLDAGRLPETVAAFERAVAATPNYAPAHAGLANACFLRYEATRPENIPDRDPLNRAITHARRACELDATLGEAWATLGFVLTAAGQVEEARAAARHAVVLEPNNWRHHFRLGLATWGEERLRAVDRTLALFPDFAPARFIASMVFIARHALGPAEETAAKASAAQMAIVVSDGSLFPSIGAHWLYGLLLLRRGQIGPAIMAFAREIDESRHPRVYCREFRVNAQIAAGYAHLAAEDASGAAEAFRSALDELPANGRAMLGLYRALAKTSLAHDAAPLLAKVDVAVGELMQGGRLAEAGLIKAAAHVTRGEPDKAIATLEYLLDHAPPGQTGWIIVVDPAFTELRAHPAFEQLLARLASRAA